MVRIFYSFVLLMLCACGGSDQPKKVDTSGQAKVQKTQEITNHGKR